MSKKLLLLISTALLTLSISVPTLAATTTEGATWYSSNQIVQVDGTNSYYKSRWDQGMANWIATTKLILQEGTNSSFTAGISNNSAATWDGITNYSTVSGKFVSVKSYINTYYTNQTRYTMDIINGIATHEMGHAMGLGHATSGDKSVMVPATFSSTGTLLRTYNTPQTQDINVMNSLYANISSSSTLSMPSDVKETLESNSVKKENVIVTDPSWAIAYEDEKDLSSYADLVVEGDVTSDSTYSYSKDTDYSSYYTDTEISIKNILKGDKALLNKNITISQMGGQSENVQVISTDTTPVKKNQHLMLFLKKVGDKYILINEDESIFVKGTSNKYANVKSKKAIDPNIIKNEITQ